MEKQVKKFDIPVLDDANSSAASESVPRYFQPGKIISKIKAADSEKDKNCDEEPTTSLHEQNISESLKYVEDQSLPVTDAQKGNVAGVEPRTRFESAFLNLRSSKFYGQDEEKVDDPSIPDAQGKVTDKFNRITGSILVNPRQRGNPLLKHIRNVPWEYDEIEPDYIMGKTTCALFLSMRYHNLFPNYIHERLKSLGKSFSLRILLVQVDVLEPVHPLKDLSVIAILADCTLMVAWSAEEAGNYLETYKMYENKSADLIKEKQGTDNYSQLIDCLTSIRSINKTDAMVLLSTFGTLEKIIQASVADLSMCPGMGPLKAKRLYDAFQKPLKNEKKK